MRDKWLLGVLCGILAGALFGVLGMVAESIGLIDGSPTTALGELLSSRSLGLSNQTTGWLVHLILSGIVGTAYVYLLSWSQHQYPYLKGAFYGATLWVSTYLLSGLLPGQQMLIGRDVTSWLTYLLLNLVYGVTLALLTLVFRQETKSAV